MQYIVLLYPFPKKDELCHIFGLGRTFFIADRYIWQSFSSFNPHFQLRFIRRPGQQVTQRSSFFQSKVVVFFNSPQMRHMRALFINHVIYVPIEQLSIYDPGKTILETIYLFLLQSILLYLSVKHILTGFYSENHDNMQYILYTMALLNSQL